VTTQKPLEVGNHYKIFDPSSAGTAKWLSLKIVTAAPSPSDDGIKCGICNKTIIGNKKDLDC